jgi:hypothetical protein
MGSSVNIVNTFVGSWFQRSFMAEHMVGHLGRKRLGSHNKYRYTVIIGFIDVQTFYAGSHRKYFPVDVDTHVTMENVEELLGMAKLKDIERKSARDIVDTEQHKVDNTPWLRRTLWPRMFSGKDMKELVGGISKPRVEEILLLRAWNSTLRLVSVRGMEGVKDCSTRGWMKLLFWLNSTDVTKANSKPFSQHYDTDTLKRYSTYWAQLVCLCLRSTENPAIFNVPLTIEQSQIVEELQQSLDENASDDDVDIILFSLSSALIQHDEWSGGFSAIQYFTGLLGFKSKTGQWESPNGFTPKLAAIQFCIRVLMLECALPTEERDTFLPEYDGNPLDVFRRVRDKWLVEGQSTPFDYIHTLLNYGLAAARNAPGNDNIRWSQDGRTLYFDGRPLEIARWKSFVHDGVDEMEHLLAPLMFISALPDVDLNSVHDNPNNHEVGHYFALDNDNAITDARRGMLARLQKTNGLSDCCGG